MLPYFLCSRYSTTFDRGHDQHSLLVRLSSIIAWTLCKRRRPLASDSVASSRVQARSASMHIGLLGQSRAGYRGSELRTISAVGAFRISEM